MTDCERPSFCSVSEPIAKKRHKCCECGGVIEKGEKHFKCTGKWNTYIDTFRQHYLCMEACMLIRDQIEHECISFGGLMDYWGEYRSDIMTGRNLDAGRLLMRMMVKIRVMNRRKRGEQHVQNDSTQAQ